MRYGGVKRVSWVLITALLLGACSDVGSPTTSGSSESSTTSNDSPSTTVATESSTTSSGPDNTTTSSGEPFSLRFVQPSASMAYLSVEVTQSAGLFAAENLEVELGPILTDSIQALLDGSADVVAAQIPQVVNAIHRGRDIKAFGVVTPVTPNDLVLSNEAIESLAALGITPSSPLADRLRALEGLTITGPAGGSGDLLFRAAIRAEGLDPETDVNLVDISDANANVASTREGQADGFWFSPPVTSLAVSDGFAQPWLAFREFPDAQDVFLIVLAANSDYLAEHREEMARFVAAMDAGFALINDQPEEAMAALKPVWFPDLDQSVFDIAFAQIAPSFEKGVVPTAEEFDATLTNVQLSIPEEEITLTFEEVFDLETLSAGAALGG